jgi:hypothetical protein
MSLILLKNKLKKIKHKINQKDIAVVCCYFNPCHYQSRLKNYNSFRAGMEKLKVKLLTVELVFGDHNFELNEFSDIIQLRTSENNIMWQKERLLNIGIKNLINEGYKKIVWLDADIVFENDDWVKDLSNELDKFSICQVFGEVYREKLKGDGKSSLSAVKYYQDSGEIIANADSVVGFGWAARADVLRQINLYDAAIIGNGDALIYYACFSNNPGWEKSIKKYTIIQLMPPHFYRHYSEWAKRFGSIIRGNVGFISHKIRASYHGELKKRGHGKRDQILLKSDYDPYNDIQLDNVGCWEWASKKFELHNEIKDYFYSRAEDH